ncbi:SET and MYND domain-containing protein 4-like isoform X1 [Metopolophium dirhodum]|uniref:SET and MYND domain-containing protein 4-like isoform X1 n=1 Tax=Metopolophium dirhodum TaxID=44670 RepID=UPI00298F8AF6|nr:SET and MYND domain-containing protein 4-like isoform X1 [Metopolophium dirhodum]
MSVNTFIRWDYVMDILTHYGVTKSFMEAFKHTPNNEKVKLCMQNEFIRSFLEKWLDEPKFNDSLKNSTKSKETRLAANEEFKMNRLELCCKLYTKAAQFAPYKSIELTLAFSNRSAVYLRLNKYQECLKDIEASLNILENVEINEQDFPKGQLIVKLLKRKIECLMALKQFKTAKTIWKDILELSKNVYKIPLGDQFIKKCKVLSDCDNSNSNDEDIVKNADETLTEDLIKKKLDTNKITLPFRSPKIELCYSKAKGRYFVASTKIEYGELLIFENPFAFVLLPEYYNSFCYNCCVPLKYYSVPCDNCCTILFCGDKCLQEAMNSYHRWECKQGTSIFKCIGIAHLALRLTIETSQANSNNDQIYNLLTHINDLKSLELYQYSLTATLLLIYLQKKTDFFEKHPNLVLDSVGNELLHHMTRLVCNGNAISTHMLSDYDSGSRTSIIDESQPRIGTAIFPTSSLLNHSCDPNIFSSNILKYVVIKASRDISEGEEITNCYGPNFLRMRLVERQASLKNQYHFDCECSMCLDPQTDDLFFKTFEGLACFQCGYGITATLSDLDVNETVYCGSCRVRFRTLDYARKLLKADKTYNKGIKQLEASNVLHAIHIISESLRLYRDILNQNNSYIAKCEDSIAKCYALAGDFENCCVYLDRSSKAIENRFGKNSLEVAYELDKITDIMVKSLDMRNDRNLIHKALTLVRRSMEIFDTKLSAWDIPYSGIEIIKHKENILLQFLEGRFEI